ncbi:4Fe-4S binding protein [Pyrobaculum sp.]|uniref:ATP-binding protein n=1 Tax=Pyrobaculum sp. TaxID=2004705 RepID=UPI003164200A
MKKPRQTFTRKVAIIDMEKCKKCNLCVGKCPTGALKPPAVLKHKCVGCGICTYACPFGAILIRTVVSKATIATVALIALIITLSVYGISLAPSYYNENITPINFTETLFIPTITPANVTMPTGEQAAGAGSGFG